jgi:hypothetical protein
VHDHELYTDPETGVPTPIRSDAELLADCEAAFVAALAQLDEQEPAAAA